MPERRLRRKTCQPGLAREFLATSDPPFVICTRSLKSQIPKRFKRKRAASCKHMPQLVVKKRAVL